MVEVESFRFYRLKPDKTAHGISRLFMLKVDRQLGEEPGPEADRIFYIDRKLKLVEGNNDKES